MRSRPKKLSSKNNYVLKITTIVLTSLLAHQTPVFAGEKIETEVSDAQAQEQKIQARLAEIAAEEKKARLDANGYYVERRSYGTQKETDPPRYVKQANKTWLREYSAFDGVDWLDLGLEHRMRYEHRDNDFRRNLENEDNPILLRTRAYVGIKKILDPLRFAIEIQDSRRENGDYPTTGDIRDVNHLDFLQGYLELYFEKNLLGKDDLGHDRPIWVRAGRHAWESVDRRLIARNEWRNTTNTFEGFRAGVGEKRNDWELELFAVQPVQRFTSKIDEADDSQNFYGVIGNWRSLSEYITFEPYYFLLKQDGDKVKFNTSTGLPLTGNALLAANIDREIHTGGLRAYGILGKTGFDYDVGYNKQWGAQERRNTTTGAYIAKVDHDAHAYNAEIGYTLKHPWKPRLSAFYGVATGDNIPTTGTDRTANERFDRLFGFARPWSNDDYIQMENIRTPKLRLEFEPKLSFLDNVKVDTGFSWYALDSATDRWNAGANLRDRTGRSGRDLGSEFDVRIRFPINPKVSLNIGYAYFIAGDFVKSAQRIASNGNDPTRSDSSNFFYTELSLYGF